MSDLTKSIKAHTDAQEKSNATYTAKSQRTSRVGTGEGREKQDNVVLYPSVPYNVDSLDAFLTLVFGTELNANENILTWRVRPKKSPVFPLAENVLLDRLEKTSEPYALYYATSTASTTQITDNEGKTRDALRNRKAAFERFHVLVLDDIGTKIPLDKIPETMQPSYIIESSEGNFQYGYVMAEPIEDIYEAEALVNVAYGSGFSDSGGNMANKLVRLPEGLNGKDEAKGSWRVRLVESDGRRWTPEELIEQMGSAHTWEELKNDPSLVSKRANNTRANVSVWSGKNADFGTATGVIDPVLEWLSDEEMITNETGEWFTIICPWGHEHTSGDNTAGYKPVGFGADKDRRAFHCFHDSCAGHKTPEFLSWVAVTSGIEADAHDFAASMLTRYILDASTDTPYELLDNGSVTPICMASFVRMNARKTMRVHTSEGKVKTITAVSVWGSSPNLVSFRGETFDPVNTDLLIPDASGALRLNTFKSAGHEPAIVDMEHVNRFLDYLRYLIPSEEEYEYFVQWLTAKIKNLGFRGAGIIMYSQGVQGVGRSTLLRMMEMIIGETNAKNVTFAELVTPSGFNHWQASPFIMVEEAKSFGGKGNFYANYERLKEIVDPADSSVTINKKHKAPYEVRNCSSIIFLSNHIDGVRLPEGDRRFYPIANPNVPNSPAFFSALRKWITTTDWAAHVYNWAQTQDVDLDMLNSPPPVTTSKTEVIEASRSVSDELAVSLTHHITGAATPRQLKYIIEEVGMRLDAGDNFSRSWLLDIKPLTIGTKDRIQILGKMDSVRVFVKHATTNGLPSVKTRNLSKGEIGLLRASVMKLQDRIENVIEEIVSELDSI